MKLGPGRLRLLDLENISLVLPNQNRYEHVREELKKRKIPDWQQHLLVMAKESLKMKQDIESCIFMTTLAEFEAYFVNTYIVGSNLVQDLLSRLFSKPRPHSYEDSIRNITSGLNGLKILKKKKLEKNLTDLQVEAIISQTLLPSDQSEFIKEWAKEKSSAVLSSTMIEPGEDDEEEEELVDFNKTIAGELDVGAWKPRGSSSLSSWEGSWWSYQKS